MHPITICLLGKRKIYIRGCTIKNQTTVSNTEIFLPKLGTTLSCMICDFSIQKFKLPLVYLSGLLVILLPTTKHPAIKITYNYSQIWSNTLTRSSHSHIFTHRIFGNMHYILNQRGITG